MSLATLQRDFGAWLRDEAAISPARLNLTDARGLSVYQNNYRGSLMACLADVMPHTLAWLGGEAFEAAAACYIDRHPPVSWTLDAYPAAFPGFLGERYPEDAEVAELAALEWRLSECFVAPDAEALTIADLPHIDWERSVLQLVPSASFLAPFSNAADIWSALAAGEVPPAVQVDDTPTPILVWRCEFTCHYRRLDPDEAGVLPGMIDGMGFTEICAHVVERLGEEAGIATAGALLARWASESLVVVARGT